MDELDFIGPNDRPALLALNNPDFMTLAKADLLDMGYKVHIAHTHEHFESRYIQAAYQVVVIEESFAGSSSFDNPTLRVIQTMPMNLRRHSAFFLITPEVETMNAMQAFSNSVHCVINQADIGMLGQLILKTVAENDLFLRTFRDTLTRVHQKH